MPLQVSKNNCLQNAEINCKKVDLLQTLKLSTYIYTNTSL